MGLDLRRSIIATAILDRLLHHSTTINIRGESYRLKDRRRAGLVTSREQDGRTTGVFADRPSLRPKRAAPKRRRWFAQPGVTEKQDVGVIRVGKFQPEKRGHFSRS